MNVKDFLKVTYSDNVWNVRDRIVCNDGYSVSVQANKGAYCTPRKMTMDYTSVELGFPNMEDNLIIKFAENSSIPTDTVYGYVDIEIVEELIEKHGGINIEKTFKHKI